MDCRHPDPKTVPWLFCRDCGYWQNGVLVGSPTDDVLREQLRKEVRPMNITIYKQANITGYSEHDIAVIRACNEQLKPEEHAPDCPVRHGASMDCVWPLAVCYSFTVDGVYNIDHNPTSQRSPSENPPPFAKTTVVQASGICFRCGRNGLVPADGLWCSKCRNELGQD